MTAEHTSDRRSLLVLVAILGGVVGLGFLWLALALWQSFGAPRADVAARDDPTGLVLVLVDGLRADVLTDDDCALSLLGELSRAGATSTTRVTPSTGTTAAVAPFLVAPTWSARELGLRSPKEIGFHRLPGEVPTLAEAAAAQGLATRGFVSAAALNAAWTGLDRGFQVWDAPGAERDFREVLDAALESGPAPPVGLLFLQLALGDAPDPTRLVRLSSARLERFAGERAAVEAALSADLETDAARVRAVERALGRKRGTPGWDAWREARYDALLEELDAGLRELLGHFGGDVGVLIAGTRGRLVTEPRPDPDLEGFHPALVRVPLVHRAARAGPLAVPFERTVIDAEIVDSPARGVRRALDAEGDAEAVAAPVELALRGTDALVVEVRSTANARLRTRVALADADWNRTRLTLPTVRVPLRIDIAPWSSERMASLGVVTASDANAVEALLAGGAGSARALGETAWAWIADPHAPAWSGDEPVVDVTRERTTWTIDVAATHAEPVLLHLVSEPLSVGASPLELSGGEVLSGPLPGAAVVRVEAGQRVLLDLAAGQRPALRVGDPEGRALDPALVRYLGRHLFADEASFLAPAWWPCRPDWFAQGSVPPEPRPLDTFESNLLLHRVDPGPTIRGPLGLSRTDVEALLRLSDDA
ncbi:MAG: hypothetical protein WD226_01120 [Planctomycetota bacterium]